MGTFELFRGTNYQYYFNFTASNGRIIIASEGYTTEQNCLNGIASVRSHSPYDGYYRRIDEFRNYRFNLVASNYQIIARSSEGYTERSNRENAIELLKREAPTAKINNRS
ncbi:YegP family protein [Dyadobacter sp. CY345]|uniref:YegP family protein n=1 Tax=Dyadobacter sp. CY345 TaxID=2909335 RepID=UPI001F1ED6C8|nr:YegP family protein [Dyadobacter sp. CY345]MCF2443277.1 YegP family protein [Dyadobacter sp. CY345]